MDMCEVGEPEKAPEEEFSEAMIADETWQIVKGREEFHHGLFSDQLGSSFACLRLISFRRLNFARFVAKFGLHDLEPPQ